MPIFTVGKNGIELTENALQIDFVRGSKVVDENKVPKLDGILCEQLIGIVIDRLQKFNQGDLRTKETSVTITKFEEGLLWLLKRTIDRQSRNVLGTYKK